ncbi:glycerophosphodiester phosphodiesterase family protein [Acholeplasma hippikon]|uniref:Cytoplasmic glycerophosphodiester phosphodiesterase n=1 Tax=Acholeplasma hippikon TaxID=264636 RepID=A0A449BL00_9MOLU|nr:glycerophosphodiester phosphodiesterase family protein [Acholeplasma hippikon]VEU83007.1 cytoplasmic glycerophosphodiester phosphodiesterase [Acholeplasma hippikon]
MKKLIKGIKVLVYVAAGFTIFFAAINFLPFTISKVKGENSFRTHGKLPLIIPHGGAKELAPENTVYAYDMLVNDFQAGVLEIDLAMTKDGVLISHHDLDLEMSPDSDYNGQLIRNYTYNEIISEIIADDYYSARNFVDIDGNKPFANLDSNHPDMVRMIPAKIEDIFANVGDDVLYILEIKDEPENIGYDAAAELVRLVEQYELVDKVVLASFDDRIISYFKENLPEAKNNAGTKEVTNFAIFSAFHIDFFWTVKSEVLILPNPSSMSITGSTAKILDILPNMFSNSIAKKDENGVYRANLMHKQLINDAHRKNMAVFYWTVDDPEEMRLLIKNGADGIITDRPDLLIEVLKEFQN